MSDFVKHTSCNLCGSSDGRALYRGGSSFCFVCRIPQGGSINPYILAKEKPDQRSMALPDDTSTDYPQHVLDWVGKYDITIPELIKHNVKYSKARDQLIFTWYSSDYSVPMLWQARNFSPTAKAKCYTRGEPEQCIPLYTPKLSDCPRLWTGLVLVEDPISAIKVARLTTSMPVLGSSLSLSKIKRLAGLPEASMGIVVWLDGNMFPKAVEMAERLQHLGCEARAVYTELDPKCYNDEEVKGVILCKNY